MMVVARRMVLPGDRTYWLGGVIARRGYPFIVDCGCRGLDAHTTRQEALDCAECLLHAEAGSIVAEKLAPYRKED